MVHVPSQSLVSTLRRKSLQGLCEIFGISNTASWQTGIHFCRLSSLTCSTQALHLAAILHSQQDVCRYSCFPRHRLWMACWVKPLVAEMQNSTSSRDLAARHRSLPANPDLRSFAIQERATQKPLKLAPLKALQDGNHWEHAAALLKQ